MSQETEETAEAVANTIETSRTDTAAGSLLALSLAEPEAISIEELRKTGVLVLPSGKRAVDMRPFVDALREKPQRIKGGAFLSELASFIHHVKRFASPSSAVFACQGRLTAVFDYHALGAPDWCGHLATYLPELSEEWKAWATGERPRDQRALAEFLEDRIFDVRDPSSAGDRAKEWASTCGATFATPSRLLELARGLQLHVSSRLITAQNLASGEVSLSYEEKHTETASNERGIPVSVKVPSAVLVGIPVFVGGALYELPVRLRYKANAAAISWTWALHRAAAAIDHAFREAAAAVAAETGLPVFFGSPEV